MLGNIIIAKFRYLSIIERFASRFHEATAAMEPANYLLFINHSFVTLIISSSVVTP